MAKSREDQQFEVSVERNELSTTPKRIFSNDPIILSPQEKIVANFYKVEYDNRFWMALYLIEKYNSHDVCIEPLLRVGEEQQQKIQKVQFFNPEIEINKLLNEALIEREYVVLARRIVEILEEYLREKGWQIVYGDSNICNSIEFNKVKRYIYRNIVFTEQKKPEIAFVMYKYIIGSMNLQIKRVITTLDTIHVDEIMQGKLVPLVPFNRTQSIQTHIPPMILQGMYNVTNQPFRYNQGTIYNCRVCQTRRNTFNTSAFTPIGSRRFYPTLVPSLQPSRPQQQVQPRPVEQRQPVRQQKRVERPKESEEKKEEELSPILKSNEMVVRNVSNTTKKEVSITMEPKKPLDKDEIRKRNRKNKEISTANQEDTFWTLIYLLCRYEQFTFKLEYEEPRKNGRERSVKKIKEIKGPNLVLQTSVEEMIIKAADVEIDKRRSILVNNLLILAPYYGWYIKKKTTGGISTLNKRESLIYIRKDSVCYMENEFPIISKYMNAHLDDFLVIDEEPWYYEINPINIIKIEEDLYKELTLYMEIDQVGEEDVSSISSLTDSETVDDPTVPKN